MVPYADDARDKTHRPWGTLALVAANTVIAAVTLPLVFVPWVPEVPPAWAGAGPLDLHAWVVTTFGFTPATPSVGTTVSSMFLHGGVFHLAGNLLYLWVFGPSIERRLGSLSFCLLYGTGGLLATVTYTLLSLGSTVPLIGASGAVSAVLGAFLVFFPLQPIRMFLYVTVVRMPAVVPLLFFVFVDNLVPFLVQRASSTAHAAHLGGFFVGAALAAGLRVVQPDRPRSARATRRDPLADALRLRSQGMLADAHGALTKLAESSDLAVGERARAALAEIEADPAFLRTRSRS